MREKSSPELGDAYALKSPADSIRLYADWAESYDVAFAEHTNYILPSQVALHFAGTGGSGPVLDVGAGTGLLAEALQATGVAPVDATDISMPMLEIAAEKGLYRRLFQADVTQPLDLADESYAGVVSSGTFTHGHVGPDAISELIRITKSGGCLVLSINAAHFRERGFEAKLEILGSQLQSAVYYNVPIYGPDCTEDHRHDRAVIAVLIKA